ncbi:MAG: Hsp20/alpha crystallin family protein [Pseudomonadota bacterium]|nr:Hsp20/alpha crystallin family protein [Pseudomonadota bacterium]
MYTSMLQTPGEWFADFEQLQDRLDELLGGRGQASSSIRAVGRAGAFPALNVGTWAEALEIYAFAPGIDPKSIDVSVEKGLLAIAGERKAQSGNPQSASASASGKPQEERNVYAQERFTGRFRRVVALPEDADPSRVEATYRNGVLKVVVPKRESSKPRQIQVASAG